MDEETWNRHLQELTADCGTEPESKTHLDEALEFMNALDIDKEGKGLLDVGANNDYLMSIIKSNYVGTDLKIGRHVFVNDAHDLDRWDSEEKDIIFCSHTLEHTIAPIVALSEMKRVMKNNGDMIIALPVWPGYMYDGHNYMMPAESWMHLFKRVGLKVEHRQDNQKNNTVFFHLKKERK